MENNKIISNNDKKNHVANGANIKSLRPAGRSMDFARSKHISHFGPRQAVAAVTPKKPEIRKVNSDIAPPTRHPMAGKVDAIRQHAREMQVQAQIPKTSQVIKQEAIAEALEKPVPVEKPKTDNFYTRNKKKVNIFGICALALFILGFSLYLNVPNLSVCFANARSGISATFPEYKPDGYSLAGPVTFDDGKVTIDFHANTGNTQFTITQSKSSWDSSAVRNMIDKKANGSTVITTEERGLTIFSYSGNAAWVNGGILYTIDGNAPLSNDQIRRIATSL